MDLKQRMIAAVLVIFAAGPATAQSVQGPVMGFLVDGPHRTLRPVLGVPGAAVVGSAVKTSSPVTPEVVSPAGDYALVWSGTSEQAALWTPGGNLLPLAEVPPGRYAVALSPTGNAAAFYSAAESLVRVISGLPSNPSPAAAFRLDTVGGSLGSFAVSDDGALVLCTAAAGTNAIVLGAPGEMARVPFPSAIGALAFVPGAHDAVIADGAEAFLVRGVDAHSAGSRLDAGDLDTIGFAAVTADGQHVLLAAADSGKVALVGVASGARAAVLDCQCQLEGLFRMNGDGAYRLGGYEGGSVRILDTASTPPRILVVTASLGPDNSQ